MTDPTHTNPAIEGIKARLSKLLERSPGARQAYAPAPAFIDEVVADQLEKAGDADLATSARALVSVLRKSNLGNITADVILVLDLSRWMTDRHHDGTVRQIVHKMLPVALHFSSSSQLALWFYADKSSRGTPVSMANYREAAKSNWPMLMNYLGNGNNEPEAMRSIIETFKVSRVPVLVIFITGGFIHKDREIKACLAEAGKSPIFWQFVGIGGRRFGSIENLDRISHNSGFFALDHFQSVRDAELYDSLLDKFSTWFTTDCASAMPIDKPVAITMFSQLRNP